MQKTVVVGAGVVGLACAHALRRRGRNVVVIDQDRPGSACSAGNAGWIVPSISAPLPGPGVIADTLKWMLRSDSPLYIAPSAVPRLARFLWSFWRHCNRSDWLRGLEAVARLNRQTFRQFDQLEADGLRFERYRTGLLFIFTDPDYMRASLAEFDHLQVAGYSRPDPLDGAALRELEPAISTKVTSGYLVTAENHVRPESLCQAYVSCLTSLGVDLMTGVRVTGAETRNGRAHVLHTTQGPVEGTEFLIAAGAWSGEVAELLGVKLPVQAGKGYSITIDRASSPLSRPLYLGEARVGCSPFEGAIRFAGTMELSGVNTVLDRRRIRGIRRGVGRYLNLPMGDSEGTEWVGMRPITPDGLPLLGRVPRFENVYIATGHAMLGVTLAPATAEVMGDLMTGATPAPELSAFEPGRFRW